MKITIFKCDLCEKEIIPSETPFIIHANQIGLDMQLTLKDNKLYLLKDNLMIKVNATFNCIATPNTLKTLHFHHDCIEKEVWKHIRTFLDSQ